MYVAGMDGLTSADIRTYLQIYLLTYLQFHMGGLHDEDDVFFGGIGGGAMGEGTGRVIGGILEPFATTESFKNFEEEVMKVCMYVSR